MNKHLKKVILPVVLVALTVIGAYCVYIYDLNQKTYEKANICQDDDLIVKLISDNVNPFSKFKFIKKRNEDCNQLLIDNKEISLNSQNPSEEICSVLADSTNSVSMLVLTYVNDMYDRETASKELSKTANLMTPYNNCDEYMDDMITLVKLKKRLGL